MRDRPIHTTPDQADWTAWHPRELSTRLKGIARPWCVVGGWALDLWHGRQTREHDDLEFAVLRQDLGHFRCQLDGMDFFTACDGIVEALPADQEVPAEVFQIWCLDRTARRWRADMMIEPGSVEMWAYRRAPTIRRARAEMVTAAGDGVPYLNPAAILLFKAKHRRAKDEEDFARALPKLPIAERHWLKASLALLHPGHDWARAL
ncbi:nucleotidyltransferase domain-containing protein [Chelatococcus reniformis]|uniref:Amino acid transporter n=1 Tax=Chelatococcus reniformis TaxID=1494448 RepID=A0A916U718_9HYPH|nr:amino acid transporter [Chelatococcus reniformis]GGC62757.1 hypothetical protein GCM10010994_21710 [Chelatococcus reniformis]